MADVGFDVVSEGLEFLKPARPTRAEIYEALIASKGNINAAVRELGSDRRWVNQTITSTPELVALLDDIREGTIDTAEQNIFADVEKGDQSASRFVVSTIGKKRGWNPGVEGSGKNGAIVVEIREFTGVKSGKDTD